MILAAVSLCVCARCWCELHSHKSAHQLHDLASAVSQETHRRLPVSLESIIALEKTSRKTYKTPSDVSVFLQALTMSSRPLNTDPCEKRKLALILARQEGVLMANDCVMEWNENKQIFGLKMSLLMRGRCVFKLHVSFCRGSMARLCFIQVPSCSQCLFERGFTGSLSAFTLGASTCAMARLIPDGTFSDDDANGLSVNTANLLGTRQQQAAVAAVLLGKMREPPPTERSLCLEVLLDMCMCRGCHCTYDADRLSTASAFCLDCKRALDRINCIARGQGPDAIRWLSKCREDTEQVFFMLRNYYSTTGRPLPGTRKARAAPKWDMVEYMEVCKASTGTLFEAVGCLMWKRQWLEFADTTAGGKLTGAQAESQWLEWEQKVAAEPKSLIWDNKGPVGSSLRIWIKEKDVVRFQSGYHHEKLAVAKEKGSRKASLQAASALPNLPPLFYQLLLLAGTVGENIW